MMAASVWFAAGLFVGAAVGVLAMALVRRP